MKVVDLCDIERSDQGSPDVAPIERRVGVTVKHDISRLCLCCVFIFQEIKHDAVHRNRSSRSVF
jgi:hypothetical protein